MVAELPKGISRIVQSKLKKKRIAEMDHGESEDLTDKRIVYRRSLVGRRERVKEGDKTPKERDRITAFVVKPYESAILVQMGKLIGVIPEGLYEIEKSFQYTGTEIIWVEKTEFKTHWGLSDIYLKDNIKIGAHGHLIAKISNLKNFVLNVVSSKQKVERDQVDEFIHEYVKQAYRQVIGDHTIDDVLQSQGKDIVKQKVQAKLFDLLDHWGIEVINLEIEGFKLPEGYEIRAEKAWEAAKVEDEIELVKLRAKKVVEISRTESYVERDKMKDEIEKLRVERELKQAQMGVEQVGDTYQAEVESQRESIRAKTHLDIKEREAELDLGIKERELRAETDREVRLKQADAGILDKDREQERFLVKTEADRDVGIAQATGIGGVKIQKKKEYKLKMAELNKKIDQLNEFLASGKMTKDVYKKQYERIEKELSKYEQKLSIL